MTVKDNRYDEDTARRAYEGLHHYVRHGYLRGDCHCAVCDVVVRDLVAFFGIEKPETGVYSPAALVREKASERGW